MKNKFADRLLGKVASGFLAILLIVCAVWAIDVNGTQVEAATVTKTDDYVVGTYSYEEIIEYRNKDANGNFGIPTCASEGEWLFAGWFKNAACTSALGSEEGPVSGTTYYAKFVSADVLSVKCQVTSGTDTNSPETVLRCVSSVDSLRYKNIGFELELPDGTPKYMQSAKVGKRINAKEGTDAYSYSPKVVDTESEYFYSAVETIKNDNFSEGYIIKPYWITKDGTKVYGVSRYVTVNEYINRNIMYIPVKMDAAPTSPAVTANGSNLTYVTYDADSGYAHFSLATDTSSLKSVTTYAVAGTYNVDKAVSANFTYRNLGTKYTGNATESGTGTSTADDTWYTTFKDTDDEFVIATSADLYGLAEVVNAGTDTFANKFVYVVCDIEANKGLASYNTESGLAEWNKSKNVANQDITDGTDYKWTSIDQFAGTFDGQMHTISGLNINANAHVCGMFQNTVASTTINDFKLVNSRVNAGSKAYTDTGSIVGIINGGTFENIYSNAIVSGGGANTGGLIGTTKTNSFSMKNCWFDGIVAKTKDQPSMGGLIGRTYKGGIISNCLNTGDVIALNSASKHVGGLIGYGEITGIEMKNCLNTGSIQYNSGLTNENKKEYGLIAGSLYDSTVVEAVYATSQDGLTYFADGTDTTSPVEQSANIVTGSEIRGTLALTAITKNLFTYVTDTYANESYWAIVPNGTPVLSDFAEDANIENAQAVDTSWYNKNSSRFTLKDAADFYGFALLSRDSNAEGFDGTTVKLGADITMNGGITYNADGVVEEGKTPIEWLSISDDSNLKFSGIFDGQGYNISGVYLSAEANVDGLFAYTDTDVLIKNFSLTNSYMKNTHDNFGSIVGYANGGTFDSIYSNANVISEGNNVGGLIGRMEGDAHFTMNNCWFNGTVTSTATKSNIGGLVGKLMNELGSYNRTITNCLNTGIVTAESEETKYVGALVGYNGNGAGLTISNCLNTKEIVYNSELSADNLKDQFYGLIGGQLQVKTELNSVYTISQENISYSGNLVSPDETYIVDKTKINGTDALENMSNLFTYQENGKYKNHWAVVPGQAPVLETFADVVVPVEGFANVTPKYLAIDTTWYDGSDKYTLSKAEQLYGFATLSNITNSPKGDNIVVDLQDAEVKLGADITINQGKPYGEDNVAGTEDDWTPAYSWNSMFVGTYKDGEETVRVSFTGKFDGQGHKISGIYLNTATDHQGLFGNTGANAEIRNFRMTDSYLQNTKDYLGSIVGEAQGGTFDSIYSDAYVISGGHNVGGLIGCAEGDAVFAMNNCWFAGNVTNNSAKNNIGGLIGKLTNASGEYARTITNCLNTGVVTAESSLSKYVGALVGYNGNGAGLTISNCLNTEEIVYNSELSADNLKTQLYGLIGGQLQVKTKLNSVYTVSQENISYSGNLASPDESYIVNFIEIIGPNAEQKLSGLFESNITESGENYWVTTTTTPVLKTFEKIALGKTEGGTSPLANAILTAKAKGTFITKTAEEYIKLEEDISLKSQVSGLYGISGGWTNGQYLYRAFITSCDEDNENNNEVVIVKYDLTTGGIVKQSERLSLNHANDITYNPKTNQLLVSHGTHAFKKVTLINAETLAKEDEVLLDCNAGIMDYNPTYDCYAIAVADKHYLNILDNEFEIIGQYGDELHTHPRFHPQGPVKGVSPQGNACDDQCIYYLFSSGEAQEYKHVITVFDWNGNYMTEIEFQLEEVEPEAISVVGNTIYVMRSKQNTVYTISF